MRASGGEVVGREAIVDGLVRECLSRAGAERRPVPIVVALGPGGSGKTALLSAVAARAGRDVPHVLIDLEERAGRSSVGELVVDLAVGLQRRWALRYRRIAFPRLMVCVRILEAELPVHDRLQARRDLTKQM